jgi:hypothetical protein
MASVRGRALANFAEARSKVLQPVILPDLQGKSIVRKRSISADLIFCYFLIKQKVKEPPRQLSGVISHLPIHTSIPPN